MARSRLAWGRGSRGRSAARPPNRLGYRRLCASARAGLGYRRLCASARAGPLGTWCPRRYGSPLGAPLIAPLPARLFAMPVACASVSGARARLHVAAARHIYRGMHAMARHVPACAPKVELERHLAALVAEQHDVRLRSRRPPGTKSHLVLPRHREPVDARTIWHMHLACRRPIALRQRVMSR